MNPSSLTTLTDGDPHVRRDADDADAVAGGGDGAGHVGAVVTGRRRTTPGPWSGRPASVQLTESAASMFGARSGWSGSMPLSRTPTRTLRAPSVTAWAWSALIMLHVPLLGLARVGGRGAAVDSRPRRASPLAGLGVSAGSRGSRRARAARVPVPGVPSVTATVRVAPTDCDRMALGQADDVGAERGSGRVRDDDADLRPGLHDRCRRRPHGPLDAAGSGPGSGPWR